MSAPLKTWFEAEGKLLRLRLSRPKANIIDAEMIAALDGALAEHLDNANVAALLIDAEGPHFSFGASVQEHLPAECEKMLHAIHKLILRLVSSPAPVLVAVRGQCLGGGLELALAGHLLYVAPDAVLDMSGEMGENAKPGAGITRGQPGIGAFMKAAVEHLTRTLAVELGPAGIRVNCIAPDFVPTAGLAGVAGGAGSGGALAAAAEAGADPGDRLTIPLGRKGRPEDRAPGEPAA